METSDSEYFESADEDLGSSDYEEESEKSKQSVGQNLSHKIIEPEVCKLKPDETTKNKQEMKERATNVGSVRENDKSQSSNKDSDSSLILVSNKCDSKNLIETSKNVNKKKMEVNTENLKEILIVEDNNKKEETLVTATKIINKNFLDSKSEQIIKRADHLQTDIVKSEPEQKEPKHETEDNLWNDDEIDWGSEAAKEESQRTEEHSPNSKNEDSGWDDFDAEWEAESQLSPEKSVQPKIECVAPKSDNASVEVEKKCGTTKEENLCEDDEDWEPLEKPEDKLKQTEEQSAWGVWGNWGVSSLLNTATQGVSNLRSTVSQGLSTVLEGGIGIPDPEELAKINALEKNELDGEENKHSSDDSPGFGLDNLVLGMSQLTKFVESTGTKVITGGLDTLEAIGKKTVEVLQEGDPGFKKKRAFLKLDTGKPNLSQILREAKEKAEEENQALQQQYNEEVKRTKNYEALFDDHQGLVHLEALEMLSKLCSIKLGNLNNSLSGDALKDMQETLEQVKELCELPEDEEEEKISLDEARETITNAVKEINIPISYDKLFLTCEEADTWLKNIKLDFIDDIDLHQQAIETLAQFTAFAVEQFHKTGELLLVKEHRSTADEADSLVQITTTLKALILYQAGKFTDKLSFIENANKDNISEHITNIFYEAANSGTYIQDAFQLLIPVLQVGAV